MASGTVKFFNQAKGFGFIAPDEGGADVFVHVSALERSGLSALNEGDQVAFEMEQDRRSGRLAATDLQLIAEAPPGSRPARGPSRGGFEGGGRREGGFGGPRGGGYGGGGGGGGYGGGGGGYGGGGGFGGPRGGGGGGASRQTVGSGSGVVKWFNPTKGFGFIQSADGGEDVFVHISSVERAGLSELREGQKVDYDLQVDGRTGKSSAANLRVLD